MSSGAAPMRLRGLTASAGCLAVAFAKDHFEHAVNDDCVYVLQITPRRLSDSGSPRRPGY